MSTIASSPYTYEPLEDPCQQIRLLTVMPNRDRASDIEAKLSVYPLPVSNAPRLARLRTRFKLPYYYALSYVWGKGSALEKTHEIILNGCRFPVTANVHAALRENRSFASWPLRLWIDTICIDQENLHEKDGQISIMREIYHLAATVLISLGPALGEDLRMMWFISNLTQPPFLNRIMSWFTNLYVTFDDRPNTSASEAWLEWARAMIIWNGSAWLMSGIMSIVWPFLTIVEVAMNVSRDDREFRVWKNTVVKFDMEEAVRGLKNWIPSAGCLRAIAKEDLGEMARLLEKNLVLKSRYFNRMWTLQECVTGVCCIQHAGLLNDLESVLKTIYYVNTIQNLHSFDKLTIETLTTLWKIQKAWGRGIRLNLRELLFHCRHRDCYDDKDVIYALLGLINGRMDPRLQPDANKSVAEVFADATQFIADSERCLDVICCREWEERPKYLPSWSPHFRRFGISGETVPLTDASGQMPIFNASLKEPHLTSDIITTTRQSNRILKVTGLYLGTVQYLSQKAESRESLDLIERRWNTALTSGNRLAWSQLKMLSSLSELLRLCNELDNAVDTEPIWAEKNERAKNLIAAVVKADTRDLLISYLLTLVCGRTSPTTRCNADEIISILGSANIRDAGGKASWKLLCEALKDGVVGRRLAVLEEGPIGAVPTNALVGDAIFVLIGCNVPVCLRKDASLDEWNLVGECYVDRYMDGEAIRQRDNGKLSARTLFLV